MSAALSKSPALRVSRQVPVLSAPVEIGPSLAALEEKILATGLSVSAVCRRAGVAVPHFYRARSGQRRASRWFIRRCDLALASLLAGDVEAGEPSYLHIRTIYRGFLAEACRLHRVDMDRALSAARGQAVQARHLAIYLVNTELAVRGATLARLFGLTRSAITQAVQAVEDRREDPAYDKAVAEIGARITGRT